MNLAVQTSIMSPHEAFTLASQKYNAAADALTFAPNVRVDVRSAVGVALEQATSAISLLTPYQNTGDMFVDRNATASVSTAKTAVTALNNALATLDAKGPAGPQIPVATFLSMAQNSLKVAESTLWWE